MAHLTGSGHDAVCFYDVLLERLNLRRAHTPARVVHQDGPEALVERVRGRGAYDAESRATARCHRHVLRFVSSNKRDSTLGTDKEV